MLKALFNNVSTLKDERPYMFSVSTLNGKPDRLFSGDIQS